MLCAEPSHLGDETVSLTRRPVRCGFRQFWLAPLRISGKSEEESGGGGSGVVRIDPLHFLAGYRESD